ncbi:MAG: DUF5916 domain-containing protein, partial [Rubricoccaceae bacterium]|nr:DUF5916 domain-containing protein [Rubricoccaceae bacterium]
MNGESSPSIDGRLDEAVWADAPKASDFVQREPNNGEPSSERTEVAILYDDDALYVGFRCYSSNPSTIVAPLARRDEFFSTDRVMVDIDSYNDDRTAFSFGVTAAGVEQDVLIYNNTEEDSSWDAVWDGKAHILPDGYSVELRIPFSQLRYTAGAGPTTWGIQYQRDIPANGESSFWAPISPEIQGYVSQMGTLEGLQDLSAPRRVEILPYMASQLTRAPGDADNPFYSENDVRPTVGFDAKVGLSSNLTLTATVNPDFGQVEADPAVVNLSAFETFFQERRPFFVEGVDIFEYGRTRTQNVSFRPTFFYSRRIGRSPQRGIGGNGIQYVDSPSQTTIAGAGKISGKVGPWSIGVLDAVTMEEQASFINGADEQLETPVEPLTNYFVGRVRRDFAEGRSVVGGILMATNRSMGSEGLFDAIMPSSAYVGGLDFEHAWSDRRWTASGVLAASTVSGTTDLITNLQRRPQRYFQRPDSENLEVDPTLTSLNGVHTEMSLARTGGNHWRASLTGTYTSPGFEVNDLGFQSRADAASLNYLWAYFEQDPRHLQYYEFWQYGGVGRNVDGDVINHYYGGGGFVRFRNQWTINPGFGFNPVAVNDRLTRGGPIAERPMDARINGSFNTDRSKKISGGGFFSYRSELPNDYNGAEAEYDRYFGFYVRVRPSNALSFTVEPEWGWEYDNDQYLARFEDPMASSTFGSRYVFSDIQQQSFSLGLRVNWTFTPELTLQLYAQPFITTGQYSNIKEFTTPGSFDFDVYGQDRGTITPTMEDGQVTGYDINPGDGGDSFSIGNPDFNFRSLRGNAVLRWEWRPGSTLFLVWQQQREDFARYDGFGIGEELGEVFRA